MTISCGTNVLDNISSDATTLRIYKQQQIASDNKLLLVIHKSLAG